MNELLSAYKRDLALKGYSECTCKHYFTNAKQFLLHYDLPIGEIGTEKIKDYLYYLITDKKASDSKLRIAYSSIKYLYCQTSARSWEIESVPQVKKNKKLPTAFSIKAVFSILKN